MKKSSTNNNLIQSVQRAINILDCFDDNHIELSLTEITKKLDLHKSTAYGIINTLYFNNYLTKDIETSKYSLGIKLLMKSSLVPQKLNLKNIAAEYIEGITNKYDLTAHLNILESGRVFCLDKTTSETSYYTLSSVVGRELPLYATASGKLALAFLDKDISKKIINDLKFVNYTENTITNKVDLLESLKTIESHGYSLELEEVEYGAISVAAPIFLDKGKILGTISITTSTVKYQLIKEDVIKDLILNAEKISNELVAFKGDSSK